jgi:hypothetical protein
LFSHDPATDEATLECKTCGAVWVVTVGEAEAIASADLDCTTDSIHTRRRGKRHGYRGGETQKPKKKKQKKDATADGGDGGIADG